MQPTLKYETFTFSEFIPRMKKGTPLHRDRQQEISEKFQFPNDRKLLTSQPISGYKSNRMVIKFSSGFHGNFYTFAATHCNYFLHNISLLC